MQLQAWLIVEIQGKASEHVCVYSSLFLQRQQWIRECILDIVLEITMWPPFTLLFRVSHFLTRRISGHMNGGYMNLMIRRKRSRIWVVWRRRSDQIFCLWLAGSTLWPMNGKMFLKNLYTFRQSIYGKKFSVSYILMVLLTAHRVLHTMWVLECQLSGTIQLYSVRSRSKQSARCLHKCLGR